MTDENTALCRILMRETGSSGKEKSCLEIVEEFGKNKNFNEAVEKLSKLLNTPKEKLYDIISTSCIPCEGG